MVKLFLRALLLCLFFSLASNATEWPNPYDVNDVTAHISAIAWDGPAATLEKTSQGMRIKVDGKILPAIFLSLNGQTIEGLNSGAINWDKFDRELNLAMDSGAPVVDIMLPNRSYKYMVDFNVHFDEVIQKRVLANKPATAIYIFLRYDSWFAESQVDPRIPHSPLEINVGAIEGNPSLLKTQNTSLRGNIGNSVNSDGTWDTAVPSHPVLSNDWLSRQMQQTQALLNDLVKSGLSKKIIGLRPTFMVDGEWFSTFLTEINSVDPETHLPDMKLVNSGVNSIFPWTNPYAFFYITSNSEIKTMYKNWLTKIPTSTMDVSALTAAGGDLPNPNEVIGGNMGTMFLGNKNAFLYNTFRSNQIYFIQSTLAKTVKKITSGKALFITNSGYLFALAHYQGAGHLGFGDVLKDPNINIIAAPYSYMNGASGARSSGVGFIPHGPMDSSDLYNKIWLNEDDSRPYWATTNGVKDPYVTTTNSLEDIGLLKRNMITSVLHKTQSYLFDLNMAGWFGSPDHASESEAIWDEAKFISGLMPVNQNILEKELAVFVDEKSFSLHPFRGAAGANTDSFSNALIIKTLAELSKLGVPFKYYRLDDINSSSFDYSKIKTAIFLNSFYVDSKTMGNITNKLLNSNRHIIIQYGFGLFDENFNFSTARMGNLLGMSVSARLSGGASAFDVTPWFDVHGSNVETISGYSDVFYKNMGSYQVSFLTFPNADGGLYKALFKKNNLFSYGDGLVVDLDRDILMIHGNKSGASTIRLPISYKVTEITKNSSTQVCKSCSSFSLVFNGPETHLFRIDVGSLPPGFFRVGGGGFITKNDTTYCSLDSAAHLNACGYTQSNYDNGVQISNIDRYTNAGYCHCGPVGLFKWEWSSGNFGGAISRDGSSFCSLGSAAALSNCGYSSQQYVNAPVKDVVSGHMIYTGECNCSH